MQIEILLEQYLKKSDRYQQLYSKLVEQDNECRSRINSLPISNEEKQQRGVHCSKRLNHFNGYLGLYKKQFVTKGEDICLNQLEQIEFPSSSLREQSKKANQALSQQIDKLLATQTQCVNFYSKSRAVFQQNVIDKLKSLVHGLDFAEL